MDGFNDEHYGVCGSGGKIGDGKPVGAYAYEYVDPSLIEPYWDIAGVGFSPMRCFKLREAAALPLTKI